MERSPKSDGSEQVADNRIESHLTMQRVRGYTYIIFCACGPVAVYNRQMVETLFFHLCTIGRRGVVIV